jgi:ribosome-associated translation inhibitor RaiA
MLVQFSFHHVSRDTLIDKAIQSHVRKLERLLIRFSPDLVRLHGLVEFTAAHQGPVCSLNLWLPTGRLNFRHEGDTPLTAIQDCFKHLTAQVKKHKAFLRREGEWRGRKPKSKSARRELRSAEAEVAEAQEA